MDWVDDALLKVVVACTVAKFVLRLVHVEPVAVEGFVDDVSVQFVFKSNFPYISGIS